MKLKNLFCAALSVALLTVSAFAAEANAPASAPDAGDYTVEDNSLFPVQVWGTASAPDQDRIELKNDNESDPNNHIILSVGEDTLILDAVSGVAATLADIKEGDTLYAYAGPAMTRSLPPIAHASLILCNIPADYAVPTWAEVLGVTEKEDGSHSVLMSGGVVLHLNADTEITAGPGAASTGIVPGTRLLSWYSAVALSMPAQATPDKVMVFSSPYGGWMDLNGGEISLNGSALALNADQQPFALDGRLMLPVRAVAEALGCTVVWDPANPGQIAVERDGGSVYAFSLNGDTVTVEGDMVMSLAHKPVSVNGVTFLAAEDVLRVHNLKLSQVSPF